MLAGLASDGGLYVPQSWPVFAEGELQALRGKPYVDVALSVMRPFLGGAVPDSDLTRMIAAAYATFDHPAVTPLVEIDSNLWLLELFHGPTLAFKDVAMQLLARSMDWSRVSRRR